VTYHLSARRRRPWSEAIRSWFGSVSQRRCDGRRPALPWAAPTLLPAVLRRYRTVLAAVLGAASVAIPPAFAIGLGEPGHNLVIGQPLVLDIPLLMSAGESVAPECLRLLPPSDPANRQFFPRHVSMHLRTTGNPQVRIESSSPIVDPIVDFRLEIGCQTGLIREYVLLPNAPTTEEPPVVVPEAAPQAQNADHAPVAQGAVRPAIVPPKVAAPAVGLAVGGTLSAPRNTTLKRLAHARYPDRPDLQEEFKRLVAEANPDLFAGHNSPDTLPLPKGTVLVLPADLPRPVTRRVVRRHTVGRPAHNGSGPALAEVTQATAKVPAGGRQDRLSIAADPTDLPPLSPRQAAAAIERLEHLADDQRQHELQMLEAQKALAASLADLAGKMAEMQNKLQRTEDARHALEVQVSSQQKPSSLGFVEMLALVLALGAVTSGVIALHHLLQMRRLAPVEGQAVDAVEPLPRSGATTKEPESPAAAGEVAADIFMQGVPEGEVGQSQTPAAEIDAETTHYVASELAVAGLPGEEVVELAEIMSSMNLGKEATRTLVEHIKRDPTGHLAPWLKAFDISRRSELRTEFEWLAKNIGIHLNVEPLRWNEAEPGLMRSLSDYEHICSRLVELWPTKECSRFLRDLLVDNRGGSRRGFQLSVAEDILLLQRILADVSGSEAPAARAAA
jgi:pilus assembly protein FimV